MYDNVRKPESDWYEAGYTAPRTDTAGTGLLRLLLEPVGRPPRRRKSPIRG